MIAFTGSTEVGKLFLRYSGESNMKRVAVECGGKSPHVVLEDCGDLDAAAQAVAWGVFYNQGEGGNRVLEETGGYFVEPTIFDAVSNEMTIAREEIFGPVLSTISFTDDAEALAIANDTIYGLAAAVWTSDVTKAHRWGRDLRAGVVWVNTFDAGDITSPFGGFKQSGFGRDKSIHALEKFTDLKAIWINVG